MQFTGTADQMRKIFQPVYGFELSKPTELIISCFQCFDYWVLIA